MNRLSALLDRLIKIDMNLEKEDFYVPLMACCCLIIMGISGFILYYLLSYALQLMGYKLPLDMFFYVLGSIILLTLVIKLTPIIKQERQNDITQSKNKINKICK